MTKVKDSELKLIKLQAAVPEILIGAQAYKAVQWLEEVMGGDSPDAVHATAICDLISELSSATVRMSIGAARLGARGGKKRAANLTPKRRSAIAKKAAAARWAK